MAKIVNFVKKFTKILKSFLHLVHYFGKENMWVNLQILTCDHQQGGPGRQRVSSTCCRQCCSAAVVACQSSAAHITNIHCLVQSDNSDATPVHQKVWSSNYNWAKNQPRNHNNNNNNSDQLQPVERNKTSYFEWLHCLNKLSVAKWRYMNIKWSSQHCLYNNS